MTPIGLSICWAVAVLWLGVRLRPQLAARTTVGRARAEPGAFTRRQPVAASSCGVHIGFLRRRRVRWWSRGPRRWRIAAVVTVLVTPLVPVALVVIPGSCAAMTWFLRRRAVARQRTAVERGLPEAADLLAASLEAGLTVRQALLEASRWSPEPVGGELRQILVHAERGLSLEGAAQAAGHRLGRAAQPLLHALLAGDRLGVPIAHSLRGFVADLARRRQLDVEARARRLPVRLSLPLVLLVLPAFGLLTVAPTLLAAFVGLGAPAAP